MPKDLKDEVALVTGGRPAIGRAAALAAALVALPALCALYAGTVRSMLRRDLNRLKDGDAGPLFDIYADLSRELGGVLGVAVLGSVLNAGYRSGLADTERGVPGEVVARAQESLASAMGVAGRLGGAEGARLADAAREAFVGGLSASLLAGAVILAVSAVGVALLVPERSKG